MFGREPSSDLDAARRNAGQDERGKVGIALDDFVRDPAERTAHGFRVEDADGVGGRYGCYSLFLGDLAGSP